MQNDLNEEVPVMLPQRQTLQRTIKRCQFEARSITNNRLPQIIIRSRFRTSVLDKILTQKQFSRYDPGV